MAATAIGTAPPIERFRQNAIETGSENLQNTVRLLATHFDRQFEDSAALQNSIIAELEIDGIGSAEVFRSEMATLEIHEALRERASGGSDVRGRRCVRQQWPADQFVEALVGSPTSRISNQTPEWQATAEALLRAAERTRPINARPWQECQTL